MSSFRERDPSSLEGEDICRMPTRAAMLLPRHFTPVMTDDCRDEIRSLNGRSTDELLSVIASHEASVRQRYAAGTLLALLGDPRIRVLDPEMVMISGGPAAIGTPAAKVAEVVRDYATLGVKAQWIMKETPEQWVELAPYRIGKFPVTNSEYRDFLLDSGYERLPTTWTFGRFPVEKGNHPVAGVLPADAEEYCLWLSKRTGRLFRLPDAAEWEFAASGPQHLEFPWGNAFDCRYANTLETGVLDTTPVGIFPEGASPFGALDMAGNVEEYLRSEYRPYDGGAFVVDDLVKDREGYREARGGCYSRFRDLARTRRRHGWNPLEMFVFGFRLVEPLGDHACQRS